MSRDAGNLPPAAAGSIEAAALQLLRAVQGQGNFALAPKSTHGHILPSLLDLANEFLMSKARSGRSIGYLELLVKQIRAFTTGRESRPLASITALEIESWLYVRCGLTKRGMATC